MVLFLIILCMLMTPVLLLLHHLRYTKCLVCVLTLLKVILLNLVRAKPNVCVLNRRNYRVYMSQGSCCIIVSNNKYLGMIVNDKVDDEEDIMRHVKRLYATGNMLIIRIRKCSDEVKTKRLSVSSAMRMAVTYGVDLDKQSTRNMLCAYNNVYRKLFGVRRGVSISAIYVNNNIDPFGVLLCKNILLRLYESDNSLIKELWCSLFHRFSSSISTKCNQVLYSRQVICCFRLFEGTIVLDLSFTVV